MLLNDLLLQLLRLSIFYFLRFFVFFDESFYRIEVALRFAAFTTFVYMFERQGKNRRVPCLTVFCIACIAIISVLPYGLAYMLSFTIYIAALIVFAYLFRVFVDTEGSIRKNIVIAIIGGLILGIGIGISADLVVSYGGNVLIAVGLFLQVGGIIIIGLSFYTIRSADEFSWHQNVQNIYVIHNSICIFAYSIEEDAQLKEGALHGGGIATVLLVSQAVSKSDEPPNHIEFQDLHFIVRLGTRSFDGGRVIVVLQVRKDLTILNEKLDLFVSSFEEKFSAVLEGKGGIVNMAKINAQSELLTSMFRLKRGKLIHDDATFLLKIGVGVICVLVSFEIVIYLLAARKGRGVSNKPRRVQPQAIQRLYLGIAGFFACCGTGVMFHVIKTWEHFFAPGPGSVDVGLVSGNIAVLIFCIAGTCIILALGATLALLAWRALAVVPLVVAPVAAVVVPGWPFIAVLCCTAPAFVVSLATIGQCTGVLKGKLRMSFQCVRAGMWVLLAGFVAASPALDDVTGIQGTAVAELLVLAGLVLAGAGFLRVSSLNELFAPSFIKELYLTAKDGRIVLRHQFVAPVTSIEESEQDRLDREAFASSIVGIDHLLHEISEGKGVLRTLVQQNDVLIIEFTPRFIGVLVSRVDLHELRFQLASLLRDAEESIPPAALEPGKETIDLPNKRYLSGRVDFVFRLHVKKLGSIVRKIFIAIETSA